MSRSLNKVTLIGNLGSDPEVRSVGTDRRVANFSLATSRQWNGSQGRKQEKTEWHRCSVWGSLADVIEKYCHKGDKLYVEGSVEYRQWDDAEGKRHYSTEIQVREIIMLGSPGGARSQVSAQSPAAPQGESEFEDFPGAEYDENEPDFLPEPVAAPARAATPARSAPAKRPVAKGSSRRR